MNEKIFEIPEKQRMQEIIEQIKPLANEYLMQSRNEKQRKIDNIIMQFGSDLIKSAREVGLNVGAENLKLEPLWSEAIVMSDRKLKTVLEYEEEKKKVHVAKIIAEVVINSEKIIIKAKIECKTNFEDFMNPESPSILLLCDKISDQYGTNIKVFSKSNSAISTMRIDGNEIFNVDVVGGEVTLHFVIEQGIKDEMLPIMNILREITTRCSEGDFFERGRVTYKELNSDGHIIREEEMTERQAIDFLIKNDTIENISEQ